MGPSMVSTVCGGRPPCGLQFVAADSRIQTLSLLAILGFRVFGAVLASPGFIVTLHRHLSDSEFIFGFTS
ncbi:hypothetical protein K438DRAFT_1967808 [Mycena galopus ATCC 62051]|nr:hypothetical protein K438DRAFT_1967808 [Mycena galopus ATCC 62051]